MVGYYFFIDRLVGVMTCTVHVYQHKGYRGEHKATNRNCPDVRKCGMDFGRNRASSYRLTGNCQNVIAYACRYPLHDGGGRDCMYLKGANDNLHHRRKYHDNNWGDEFDGIGIRGIPSANRNQFQHDMHTKRYTPASPGDRHCGGCRLWPQVKNRGAPERPGARVWMDNDVSGVGGPNTGVKTPCPGGSAYFNSGSGIRCIYKNDENAMKALFRRKDDHPQIRRMYDRAVQWFCGNPNNLMRSPDGSKKCRQIGNGNDLARAYCKHGKRIKPKLLGGDDACDKKQINNESLWEELATNYCKANKADAWCACYNASSGRCDKDRTAAGCDKVMQEHDAIIKSLPSSQVGTQALKALNTRKNCRAGVCNGSVFRPSNLQGCDLNIEMCVQEVTVGGSVVDSGITMKCEKGDVTKGGGKGTVERNETREQQLERLRKENPDSSEEEIMQMAALEEKGWSTSKKALVYGGGVTGISFSSCCCCLIIVVIIIAATSKGNSGARVAGQF